MRDARSTVHKGCAFHIPISPLGPPERSIIESTFCRVASGDGNYSRDSTHLDLARRSLYRIYFARIEKKTTKNRSNSYKTGYDCHKSKGWTFKRSTQWCLLSRKLRFSGIFGPAVKKLSKPAWLPGWPAEQSQRKREFSHYWWMRAYWDTLGNRLALECFTILRGTIAGYTAAERTLSRELLHIICLDRSWRLTNRLHLYEKLWRWEWLMRRRIH